MFVLIECKTCQVGTETSDVYEFEEDMDDEGLDAYARDIAYDNAESYGVFDEERAMCEDSGIEFDESECYSYSYTVLKDMTREQVIEEYGDILPA